MKVSVARKVPRDGEPVYMLIRYREDIQMWEPYGHMLDAKAWTSFLKIDASMEIADLPFDPPRLPIGREEPLPPGSCG